MVSCISSSRIANGLINSSVGVMALMHGSFMRLKKHWCRSKMSWFIKHFCFLCAVSWQPFFIGLCGLLTAFLGGQAMISVLLVGCPLEDGDDWSVPSSLWLEFRVLLNQRERCGWAPDRLRREQHFNERTEESRDGWEAQAQTQSHIPHSNLDIFSSAVLCWCKLSSNNVFSLFRPAEPVAG